jgi:hypothetical protein
MMLGAIGSLLVFFFATMGVVIIGLYYLAYAAHCFLVILEGTAAGDDAVVWPDEPMFDWLWKLFYLASLVAVWFAPAWLFIDVLLGRALRMPVPPAYAVLLCVLWLLFPISLLSSLSANLRWMILRPALLGQLARHGVAAVGFFAMTGILVLVVAAVGYFALFRLPVVVPVAAMGAATGVLVYARLLGRLGWVIAERDSQPTSPARKKRKRKRQPDDSTREKPTAQIPDDIESLGADALLSSQPEPETPREEAEPESAEDWAAFMPPGAAKAAEPAPGRVQARETSPVRPDPVPARPVQAPAHPSPPPKSTELVDHSPLPVPADLDVPRRVERPRASLPLVPDDGKDIGLVPLAPREQPASNEEEWQAPAAYDLGGAEAAEGGGSNVKPAAQSSAHHYESYDIDHVASPKPASIPIPLDGYTPVEMEPWRPEPSPDGDRGPVALERPSGLAQFEERLTRRRKPPPPPAHPLWNGVYAFPWYPTSFRAWINLSFIGLVLSGLLLVQILTWPF